jgi:hypothetical protein
MEGCRIGPNGGFEDSHLSQGLEVYQVEATSSIDENSVEVVATHYMINHKRAHSWA